MGRQSPDGAPLLKDGGRPGGSERATTKELASELQGRGMSILVSQDDMTPARSYGASRSTKQGADAHRLEKRTPKSSLASKRTIIARYIVENKYFVFLTTLLTVFALVGDDLRLACTNKPADAWFNVATGICLCIFSIEVILSCRGKDDYFLSFFFYLDTMSTVTLLLDITTINDALIQANEEEVDNMRGFEAAQLAKAGRVVRVLRLVRILKLYKALHESKQARKKRTEAAARPGEEDKDTWDDLDVDNSENLTQQRESRVGKKLSDYTTRRVILLVLLMLLVLPFLTADETLQLAKGPSYGADVVHRSFVKHLADLADERQRKSYELSLLQYIYYHNWFTAEKGECPDGAVICPRMYLARLFWVGIVSTDGITLVETVRQATIDSKLLASWEANVSAARTVYRYGTMPDKVLTILSGRWDAACRASKKVQRLGISLLEEEIDGLVSYAVRCPEDLRRNERVKYAPRLISKSEAQEWHFAFYFDMRELRREQSIFGLLTTAFVCLVLTVASIGFSNDANTLVLAPVEQMISKVEIIQKNPLHAMKMADDEFKAEEISKAKKQQQQKNRWTKLKERLPCASLCGSSHPQRQEPMETVILEKTIIKLGSLLALGFGEAGADIIAQNMHGVDSASINAMIEGMCVDCIIGCVRIKDFSTATEVLDQQVMKFVNQIAEIVHGVVNQYHGAANKNNGDTFLIIWRVSDDEEEDDIAKLADMSMLAFAEVFGAIHSSQKLAEYRGHPGFIQRLGRGTRVNLTFGLHYGWAIEGAVGSEFKIDPSYLSPNVSICETIEKATVTYGVGILLAESVVGMCSAGMASKCRRIDRVIITGQSTPMELYVLDLDSTAVPADKQAPKIPWSTRQRYRIRQFLDQEKNDKWNEDSYMVSIFEASTLIKEMRFRYTEEFLHSFNQGYQNYIEGEWSCARRALEKTKIMLGTEDGPSAALLKFMELPHNFEAPSNWNGTRELRFN